ncbi:hypothetical protein BN168_200010 [Clostridioides difficile CD002]|nr:hypothetical protein BN167_330010 [Clostridioides difficile E13]CCL05729.1 hypothetical protein BN168_200010 [Clostridioides difficile CD002]
MTWLTDIIVVAKKLNVAPANAG